MSEMKGADIQARGLGFDAGLGVHGIDQATLFRAVDEGKTDTVAALLRNRQVDVNAYNDEVGLSAFKCCEDSQHTIVMSVIKISMAFLMLFRLKSFAPVPCPSHY